MGEQGSLQVADGHVADVATRVTAHASHSLEREGREGEGRDEGGEKGGDRRGGEGRGRTGRVNINTTNMNPLVHTTTYLICISVSVYV